MLDMVNDIVLSILVAVTGGALMMHLIEDIVITIKSIVDKLKGK